MCNCCCFYSSYESLTSKKARDVSISNNGTCRMEMSESMLGVCKSNAKLFPLDVHNCSFELSVTNVPLNKGNLQLQLPSNYNTKAYTINGKWSLQSKIHQVSLVHACELRAEASQVSMRSWNFLTSSTMPRKT